MNDNIIRAQALREAANRVVSTDKGIPWDHDYDRAEVAAWLYELADDFADEGEEA